MPPRPNRPAVKVPVAVASDEAFALLRRLNPAQQATRQSLIDAAIELATEHGYDAITTRSIAAHAGVAIATFYRYFTSKDHILAQAMADWGTRFVDSVMADPPRGATAADRVIEVFRRVASRSQQRPRLMDALYRAAFAHEPAVQAVREQRSLTAALLELAIGDVDLGDLADRDEVLGVFEDVATAALRSPNVVDRSQALVDHIARAARLLLRDVP